MRAEVSAAIDDLGGGEHLAQGRDRAELELGEVRRHLVLGDEPQLRSRCVEQVADLAELEAIGGLDHDQPVAVAVVEQHALGGVVGTHPRRDGLRGGAEGLRVLDHLVFDPELVEVPRGVIDRPLWGAHPNLLLRSW